MSSNEAALVPYDSDFGLLEYDDTQGWARHLWPYRTSLKNLKSFGNKTRGELGEPWWSWYRWIPHKLQQRLSLVYAKIATHFHGAIDRGGHTFNGSVFVVKLKSDESEPHYLGLLGVLNSSLACFWMKQVFHPKATAIADISLDKGKPEANRYELAATGMKTFPLVTKEVSEKSVILSISTTLDSLASQLDSCAPSVVLSEWLLGKKDGALEQALNNASERRDGVAKRMYALQEELDWEVYRCYGLVTIGADADLVNDESFAIDEWMRPFRWGAGHLGEEPEKPVPEIYQQRRAIIDKDADVRCIETLVFKRPWWGKQGVYGGANKSYHEQACDACKEYLLNHLESDLYWLVDGAPQLLSVAELCEKVSAIRHFREVASVLRGREDFDLYALVSELVQSASVPLLNGLVYKASGLRKRKVWESVWEQQREEDNDGNDRRLKAPPYFNTADYESAEYWRLRGKMDVPKERWISFPYCETESDPSLVLGWAGWNHLQQATALIAYYDARKRDGWDAKRLTPLLASLDQLLPWIHQWHPEIDPEFGETAGQSFETMLKADAHELGLTLEDIRAWVPPVKKAAGKPRKTRNTRKKATQAEAEENNHE